MMEAVDISKRSRAIGAPKDWDQSLDGGCGVLPVRDGVDLMSGARTMTSAWKPDANDLMFLNKGLPILLTIFGVVHPVVSLGIGQPDDLPDTKPKP
jgi:hypothetical protein